MLISVDMEANGSKVEPMLGWPPILAYPLKGKRELIRVRILGPPPPIHNQISNTNREKSK